MAGYTIKLALALWLAIFSSGLAETIVDQNALSGSEDTSYLWFGESLGIDPEGIGVGQTITVGATGVLAGVDLQLARVNAMSSFLVYVLPVDERGSIGSVEEAYGHIAIGEFGIQKPTDAFLDYYDLSALNIRVRAGDQLALAFGCRTGIGAILTGQPGGHYLEGDGLTHYESEWVTPILLQDVQFRTHVTVVPEPTQWVMLAILLSLGAAFWCDTARDLACSTRSQLLFSRRSLHEARQRNRGEVWA